MKNNMKIFVYKNSAQCLEDIYKLSKIYPTKIMFQSDSENQIIKEIYNYQPKMVIFELLETKINILKILKNLKNSFATIDTTFVIIVKYINLEFKKIINCIGISNILVNPMNYSKILSANCNFIDKFKTKNVFHPTSKYKDDTLKIKDKNSVIIENKITNLLHDIGIPTHLKGYHYLRNCIITAINHPTIEHSLTKYLYPETAKKFNATSATVERAIRHAIEISWKRGDINVLNKYFGYTVNSSKGRPTNSEFISMISDKLLLQYQHSGNINTKLNVI